MKRRAQLLAGQCAADADSAGTARLITQQQPGRLPVRPQRTVRLPDGRRMATPDPELLPSRSMATLRGIFDRDAFHRPYAQ